MQEIAVKKKIEEEEEEELEFSFLSGRADTSPISADEIFCNGQIKPTYPLPLNLLSPQLKVKGRLPLKKLLSQEREWNSSNSNSTDPEEELELEGVSPELYCAWRPKVNKANAKVVHMTPPRLSGCYDDGLDSKRWKLKDLLVVANRGRAAAAAAAAAAAGGGKKGRSVRVASQSF